MPPLNEIKGVSIDIGGTLGYTLWVDGFPHASHILDIRGDYPGEEYAAVRLWLSELPLSHYSWVAYEECRPKNLHHMRRHFGVLGHLAYKCWQLGIPMLGIETGKWKKALGIKGNSGKDIVLERASALYPHLTFDTHDASDSLGIGYAALQRITFST